MGQIKGGLLLILFFAAPAVSAQSKNILSMTRAEAEHDAIRNSAQIRSYSELTQASQENADAQYADLFPRVTLDFAYRYLTQVPKIQTQGNTFFFGDHHNYTFGPTLTYTLWDTHAKKRSYESYSKITESREQNRKNEELRLLLETRNDYIRVQENLEELRAVSDSLSLARSQSEYIVKRLRSGAATTLDRVESERAILSYQIQFDQKQAELSASIKDLLARTQNRSPVDLSRPGISGLPNVTLIVAFDPIQKSLEGLKGLVVPAPDNTHPALQSIELQAQSAELRSQSIKAAIYPTLDLRAGATLQYPFPPDIHQVNQNFVAVSATLPIFEMNRTRHLSEAQMRESDSARYQKIQTQIDLNRDFGKSKEMLASLLSQQALAEQDVMKSAESARMYYEQYRAGKVNLIDVQNADNRALLSKVNKARIDAQILSQAAQLKALSGREIP